MVVDIDPQTAEDLALFFMEVLAEVKPSMDKATVFKILLSCLEEGAIDDGTTIGQLLLATKEAESAVNH